MQITHPINDPSLVSFHDPALVKLLPGLEVAMDCWNLMNTETRGSAKNKYLYKEKGEASEAYKTRLSRATYTPIYRDSIKAYAGLLSRFQLVDPPASLLQYEQDVDLQGSSIQAFWNRADELAIRDGGCYIFVNMPDDENAADNYQDSLNDGRHPYLQLIERKDIINWSTTTYGGYERINRATFRQVKAVQDMGYGSKMEACYYDMRPGSITEYRLQKTSNGWAAVQEGDTKAISMPFVPLVWYGASTSRFGQGDIPLNGLAELSIQHFQCTSDLQELIRKCAMPVPVRKGVTTPDGVPKPLYLGPNTAIDLGEAGDFKFEEPSGRSLYRHQKEIEHIEMLMDRSGLNFLYGANIKTATEASLRASQVASQVSAVIRHKISSFKTVIRLWALFMGEQDQITRESGLAISDSLINRPLDPNGVAQIINLNNNAMMSLETSLRELQRGGAMDPDISIEEEVARIRADKQQAESDQLSLMAKQQQASQDVDQEQDEE